MVRGPRLSRAVATRETLSAAVTLTRTSGWNSVQSFWSRFSGRILGIFTRHILWMVNEQVVDYSSFFSCPRDAFS
jgi:hypothetical protein